MKEDRLIDLFRDIIDTDVEMIYFRRSASGTSACFAGLDESQATALYNALVDAGHDTKSGLFGIRPQISDNKLFDSDPDNTWTVSLRLNG